VDQALIITAGILEALAYSHRHGIVHRDIKPANVIITSTGAVKVMDFGIARALTGATSTMTQTGMVMGTPQYLSPEQALGKPVDHRSDLYATGCMLYELLALRPPFTGDTPLSVVYQHVQDPPVPPSQANPRVPAGLDPLVLRALAKEPDDRYQTADEFRAHVQHALRQMHAATGVTEVLPPAALAAEAATPTTKINSVAPPPVPVAPSTPQLGTPVAYQGEGDEEEPERRGKVAFAVIAVLVGVAAVALGIALALHNGGGTPKTGTSSTPPPTSAPATTEAPATSAPATTQAPTTSAPTPTPTRTRSTPTTSPSPTASPTPTETTSPSPTETTSPTSPASPSATPTISPTTTTGSANGPTGGATPTSTT
jgi:serine/threonine-protein kinase